jgi:tRNA A-37 threonylcarbamoyl transferase component Bud32/tetratricopeptide (TPR) repeat protein
MTEILERLTAALASTYAIERELGAGGMATVYLAEDLKHHRKVALKVLRPDLAATLGPDRFLREVTIAANLQHPHILPVYDSGQADGLLYYVMPFVEGPSLRDRLVKERELPVIEAVRILRDVADAMAAAHAKGVVHRDIKPENVMLSGRHALVADFGVAKAVSEATGRQTLTTAGVALGTPTYMAPEQAAADPHLDHRADIYAFGVTAYEMLTGQPPFVGPTAQMVLAAHLTEAPLAVTQRRPAIPAPLAQLVMRCLEKTPADRPQSAEELLPVLEALGMPSGGITPTYTQPVPAVPRPPPKRWPLVAAALVVLAGLGTAGALTLGPRGKKAPTGDVREPVVVVPFEVQATDPELANLGQQAADRIAAAITEAGLGAVASYRAAADDRGAAFARELGRRVVSETGAATLVIGAIYQQGDSLEMRAQLLRAADFEPLFSLPVEHGARESPGPVLAAITQRVLGAVGRYLSPAARGQDVTLYHPPSSLEALRLFEKADQLFRGGGAGAAVRPLLIEALRLDTTLYSAAELLARSYWNASAGNYRNRRASDSILEELEARRSRLTVGEGLDLDWQKALRGSPEAEYRAAIAGFRADPGWAWTAMYSSVRAGRPEEALRYHALRDTTTVWGRDWQAWDTWASIAYHALGRFEDELALARAARAREPRAFGHWQREVSALAALGRTEEIERAITQSHTLEVVGAPVRLMNVAANEFHAHGPPETARSYGQRVLAGVQGWSDSLQRTIMAGNLRRAAYRVTGDHEASWRIYDQGSRAAGAGGVSYRILGMRDRIMMGDTAGALALVDSARTLPVTAFADWQGIHLPRYHAANLLSLLGRRDEAVAMLRDALNNGWRLAPDEALQWYWAPIKDYPPFRELVKVKG